MKRISAFVFLSIASLACGEVLVEENFDNPNAADRVAQKLGFSERVFAQNSKFLTFENDALVVDASDAGQWPKMLMYPQEGNLKSGYVYKVSFDYEVLRTSSGEGFIANIGGVSDGKFVRYGGKFFGIREGSKGHCSFDALVLGKNSYCKFVLSERFGSSSIRIDNFKIERLPAPEIEPWLLEKDAFVGFKTHPVYNGYILFNPDFAKIKKEKFFPFIDEFGQFKHYQWKNKVHSVADLKRFATEERKFLNSLSDIPARDSFGGLIDDRFKFEEAENFRVKKVGGKWYFITPEGNLFWSLGVNAVGLYQGSPFNGVRVTYFDKIPNDKFKKSVINWKYPKGPKAEVYIFERKNLELKYGENSFETTYPALVGERIRKWGFNSMGWPDLATAVKSNVPFACVIGSGAGKIAHINHDTSKGLWVLDFFNPEFEIRTRKNLERAKFAIASPYSFGVYIDNELKWSRVEGAIGKAILKGSQELFSKKAFRDFLESKYKNVETLNKAWNAKFADWNAFLANSKFVPKTEEAKRDILDFEYKFYEKYFSVCKKSLASVAPNKLYLGCRFADKNDLLVKAASFYCDVVSFNIYRDSVADFALPKGAKDVPVIIGEFHFCNFDRGNFGSGIRHRITMEERVKAFRKYINGAVKNPILVGAHWFRWCDQVASGRPGDGENFSCGLVDVCDTPIYEMVEASRKLQRGIYKKRLSK